MKKFMDENFMLNSKSAERLYHEYAKEMPIIDYHNHLPPHEIAGDVNFKNLTQIWLYGDHYKWRAMRANGIDESLITGKAPDYDKFEQWAATVPYTLRNPLYHWTHMELQRYFGINELLNPKTAKAIYDQSESMLQQPDFSVHSLLKRMKVDTLCTTDDPADSLEYHIQLGQNDPGFKTLPTWRPDKAMNADDATAYNLYLDQLGAAADIEILTIDDLLSALQKRHDFFHEVGCRISDHGIEEIYAEDFTASEIDDIFGKVRAGNQLDREDLLKFKSFMLLEGAKMDHASNWTQQFHYGVMRNNNSRMFAQLGPDTGYDSIGDFKVAKAMVKFFNTLESNDQLAKTIIYNINPGDNEMIATMLGNFNKGPVAGKIQFGSGWWFLDQKQGMIEQMNSLSALGLISKFVGMLTDSRSFLSFPRHEYFRRIMCNLFGEDMENGELPNDFDLVGGIVQDISYNNAKNYFNF
ncbi:glucuronate isomerase [Roseimarinus sediminis]|uniref:glucuronate isomerase n=1 Tax=Roseimarinus sediminis TaxID=1610899 RepID=UPI003D1DCBA7